MYGNFEGKDGENEDEASHCTLRPEVASGTGFVDPVLPAGEGGVRWAPEFVRLKAVG